jgi:2-polyprenyl-3-methyl-5-hydroxy-6-metoxy-1,4-benzoquinol methylase
VNGAFVEIDCPVCGSNSFKTVLEITPDKFLSDYRKKYYDLKSLDIDLNTKFYFKKCKKCSFVFVNPRFNENAYDVAYNEAKVGQYNYKDWLKDDSDLTRLYNTHSKYYSALNLLESLIYIKNRFHEVNNKDKLHIRLMDYGCGFGHILDLCKPFGIEAVGIEIDERRLEYCKSKGLDVRRPEELSEKEKFDVVISWSVIEHVNDLNAYFSYVAKRIYKGGFFIVHGLTDKMIYVERLKGTYKYVMPIEHINYFTPKSFNQLILRHGFKPVHKMKMVQSIDNYYRLLFPFIKIFFKGFYPNGVFKMDLFKIDD